MGRTSFARAGVVTVLLGCGPAVAVPDGTQGEGSTGGETTGGSSSSTSTPTSTSTSTTTTTFTSTSTSTSTSGSTGDGTTTEEPWSETTEGCSCEGMPIAIDDEIDEGTTPAEILASTAIVQVALDWIAIPDATPTTTDGSTSWRGGSVIDEVGGCCGSFLCVPCPAGVTIEDVSLTIATDDGRVDDVFTGRLLGPSEFDGTIAFASEPTAIDALTGTLGTDNFVETHVPFVPTRASVLVEWSFDDFIVDRVWVTVHDDGFESAVVGAYEPP